MRSVTKTSEVAQQLAEPIAGLARRSADLYARVLAWDGGTPDGGQTLDALKDAVAELLLANEELRAQNQGLEEAAREIALQEHRYRELFDLAPDAYLVTGADGRIQESNRAAGELLNVPPERLVGKPLANFVDVAGRPAFREALEGLRHQDRSDAWPLALRPRRRPPRSCVAIVGVARAPSGHSLGVRWILRVAPTPP